MEKTTPLLGRFLWLLNIAKTVFKDARTKMHVCEMGVASLGILLSFSAFLQD